MQLELTFGNDQVHLPSVRAFLSATLRQLPLPSATLVEFEAFVMGAVERAIAEAYPVCEQGSIRLSIEVKHGRLDIQIRDFGIPKDVAAMERELQEVSATARDPWTALAVDAADEVHWQTFGPQGKALQVVKWLHETHIADASSDLDLQAFCKNPPLAPEQEYAIRRMRASEAEQVSQLMYRTYGATYFNDDVYYPDRVAAQNDRGVVLSYVAVGQDGLVAGHYALERNQEGPVAEGGQAVVDPSHRRRGLTGRMKQLAAQGARHLELVGWYANAVTVHTLTQRSNAAHGGRLVAADLAIAPKSEHFDQQHEQPQRVTCLLYFHWLKSADPCTVHVPARHREIVAEIYQRLERPVEFGESRSPSGRGTMAVKIDGGAARANVYASVIGADTVQLVRRTRRELVERNRIEAVFVDLPIENPATAHVAEQLERDGFGFLGVAPHFSQRGDLLRLGYLVEPVAREPIKTLDEAASRLVDYALGEQLRVRSAP